jgi:RES domain-containing protein
VSGVHVLDLRRPAVRRELGVSLAELIGPREAAQRLGARARELGAEGLIVPSAAREGHWNLVAFPSAFAKLRVGESREATPDPPTGAG